MANRQGVSAIALTVLLGLVTVWAVLVAPQGDSCPDFLPVCEDQPSAQAQFVRNYFALVNSRDYGASWEMLTEGYQKASTYDGPGSAFENYVTFWNSYSDIRVTSVQNLNTKDGERSVDVQIDAISENKTIKFYLVYSLV